MADMNGTQLTGPVNLPLTGPSNSSSSRETDAAVAVQIVATLIIFLVGVPLNGLVVWALGLRSNRHLVRRGSSEETRAACSFRVYVLNLALADLVLLLRTPLMIGYLAHQNSWPFGRALCHLTVFLRGLGLYASAFLLCAVSLERCLCLMRPVWAGLRRPSWAVPLACGVLWFLATALSIPYFYSAVLKEDKGKYQCLESGNFTMALFITETTAGFILPLLVFLGSNLAVLFTIQQAVPPTPTSSSLSTNRRMTRMYHVLFFTMLLFLTCWVPYFVCRFLRALTTGQPEQITLHIRAFKGSYISLFLVYIKSALNPVLYVFAARGLGRAIKASVVSTIERLFSDDTSESIRRKSLKNSQL
ncbi:C5a anaphylatoxin chemotactic receptor 1 [Mastacembelus armatus]|uniref:C5a anaphylatoxin chemotactic receptor 1-like n=1 Tax=Mastacembelus armatus TaxID=205130 RepID=A0A3Q3L4D1_9TELE|nr:C5a anaphylatoxin chemotactic receptor 1-like [Mastacembelus armatus]XP_026176298.1 C5a anaphylatoxin chemotactic receptor 1-like [Mastacembelus armatus]XP_026176299.1 C5a anaphylatoxin chemotactic receptor 1-like [Mastacembelus armatus]